MSKLVITIDLDNDAFQEDQEGEVRRILRNFPLLDGWKLHDINGNAVGLIEVKEDETDLATA